MVATMLKDGACPSLKLTRSSLRSTVMRDDRGVNLVAAGDGVDAGGEEDFFGAVDWIETFVTNRMTR